MVAFVVREAAFRMVTVYGSARISGSSHQSGIRLGVASEISRAHDGTTKGWLGIDDRLMSRIDRRNRLTMRRP